MKKKTNAGFTLIELMIVVAIIGVLAVLAIFGVSKYLRTAKTAEATNSLGAINQDAVQAYTKERAPAKTAIGMTTGTNNVACVTAAAMPGTIPKNQKWTANPAADYATDPGWSCLGFSMNQPQYFQYDYVVAAAASTIAPKATFGGDGTGWATGAAADFDGDGTADVQFATGANIPANSTTPITATAISGWDVKANAAL